VLAYVWSFCQGNHQRLMAMASGLTVVCGTHHVDVHTPHQNQCLVNTHPPRAGIASSTFQNIPHVATAVAFTVTAAWCGRLRRRRVGFLRHRCPGFVQCRATQDDSKEDEDVISGLFQSISIGLTTGLGVVLLFKAVMIGEKNLVDSSNPSIVAASPILGGALVTAIFLFLGGPEKLDGTSLPVLKTLVTSNVNIPGSPSVDERAKRSVVRSALAAVTLGTGNALGPEGPCVELAANVAAYFGRFGEKAAEASILASGCAAGVAAGFNAPLSGIVFATEVVKPSQKDGINSVVNRLLAATAGATVVQILLGSTPPFTGVQFEDFRSSSFAFAEVPLYAILGGFCGILSALFDLARNKFGNFWKELPISRTYHPLLASLLTSAVVYFGNMPFLLYKGFDNINEVLRGAGELGLAQLAGLLLAKIVVSSVSLTSGLVGGVFAPALFIGASGGALYGQGLSVLAKGAGFTKVVSPAVDYSAAGAAACLASLCGVPVTGIVLLLEVSGGANYTIVLPLIAAVGISTFLDNYILNNVLGAKDAAKSTVDRVATSPVESLFDNIDTNKDGVVSKEEFEAWYRALNSPVKETLQEAEK